MGGWLILFGYICWAIALYKMFVETDTKEDDSER